MLERGAHAGDGVGRGAGDLLDEGRDLAAIMRDCVAELRAVTASG